MNRRTVMSGLIAAPVLAASPAFAFNVGQAEQLVDRVVADINKVISSGKSEPAMIRDFEKIFVRYADVPTIARYALGPDGRTASNAQISAFTKSFQGYIARKYGRRFREFAGGRIEVKGAKKVKSFYEVQTTAYLKGERPFDLTFLVSDRSGKELFFNMFIEGVNLLLTERTEIGALLDRRKGNLDQLISDLRTI